MENEMTEQCEMMKPIYNVNWMKDDLHERGRLKVQSGELKRRKVDRKLKGAYFEQTSKIFIFLPEMKIVRRLKLYYLLGS